MKSILVINNVLKNSFIEENDFSNDISFNTNKSLPKTNNSSITVNFVKNITLHNDIEEDSTIERIIDYVKNNKLKETEEKLFKLLDTRNSIKFNDDKDQLKIDILQQTISTLLYEIIKLN